MKSRRFNLFFVCLIGLSSVVFSPPSQVVAQDNLYIHLFEPILAIDPNSLNHLRTLVNCRMSIEDNEAGNRIVEKARVELYWKFILVNPDTNQEIVSWVKIGPTLVTENEPCEFTRNEDVTTWDLVYFEEAIIKARLVVDVSSIDSLGNRVYETLFKDSKEMAVDVLDGEWDLDPTGGVQLFDIPGGVELLESDN